MISRVGYSRYFFLLPVSLIECKKVDSLGWLCLAYRLPQVSLCVLNADLPVGGMDQDTDNRDNSTTYVPQPPPRSHAPAVFKAWRQESYRSTMNQVKVALIMVLCSQGLYLFLVSSVNSLRWKQSSCLRFDKEYTDHSRTFSW